MGGGCHPANHVVGGCKPARKLAHYAAGARQFQHFDASARVDTTVVTAAACSGAQRPEHVQALAATCKHVACAHSPPCSAEQSGPGRLQLLRAGLSACAVLAGRNPAQRTPCDTRALPGRDPTGVMRRAGRRLQRPGMTPRAPGFCGCRTDLLLPSWWRPTPPTGEQESCGAGRGQELLEHLQCQYQEVQFQWGSSWVTPASHTGVSCLHRHLPDERTPLACRELLRHVAAQLVQSHTVVSVQRPALQPPGQAFQRRHNLPGGGRHGGSLARCRRDGTTATESKT